MLSRHAEDLYWAGRYVERAEDTARMLDVTYHGLLESPPEETPAAWRELLEVLFLDGMFPSPLQPDDVNAASVTEFLVLDLSNPGSIIAAVGRTRDNIRGVRDRVSTELWEAINTFYLELQDRDLRRELVDRPYEVYRMVKVRCQTISGVAAETMPRDDGYRFLLLGRMVERAEMTCRMLAVRYFRLRSAGRAAYHQWVAVLKSVSAYEAYLKEHLAALEPTRVLEFLLLSPTFPRSVLYALRAAEWQLDELIPAEQSSPARRLLGMVRSRLEYCDVEEVLAGGLDEFLERIQEEIYRVDQALDAHFFRTGTALDLIAYEST